MGKEKAGNLALSLLSFVVVLDINHEASTHTHYHEDLSIEQLILISKPSHYFFFITVKSLLYNTRQLVDLYAGILHAVFFNSFDGDCCCLLCFKIIKIIKIIKTNK